MRDWLDVIVSSEGREKKRKRVDWSVIEQTPRIAIDATWTWTLGYCGIALQQENYGALTKRVAKGRRTTD